MAAPEQGDVGLLDDPAAQQLLLATVPAHLANLWTDGTPRNTPIWFHWDGRAVVILTRNVKDFALTQARIESY